MANAKIEYIPYPSRAASIPGTLYLALTESTNLIGVNPGAESGDETGWLIGGTGVTTTNTYSGTYKFEIAGGGGGMESDTNNLFDLTRGQEYKIIIPMRIAAGTGDSPVIWIKDENSLVIITYAEVTNYLSTTYKLLTINFTPTQNYTNCKLVLQNNEIESIYIDDVFLAPEYLDMGLDDFSIDILHQPLTQSGDRTLVRKHNTASPFNGYHFYYNGTDYKYNFFITDGITSISASSAAVTAIQNQEYHWVRVTLDRSGNLIFYVNGVASGSPTSISTIGNCSSIEELRLFGWDSVTDLYKGFCDFIRFQRGTIMSAAWMAEEWARIQAGRIRGIPSATALWDFNDDLVDGCQGLILTTNTGAITYTDGWPYSVAPVSYTFAVNYRHDYKIIPLASDSLVRAYRTGAAYNMAGPRKSSYELSFVGITQAQYSAFLAAYEGGEVMDIWLDSAEEQTAKVYFSEPPQMEGIPYFRSGELVVNTTLYLVDS